MNKQMIEELAKQAGLMCLYDYGPEEDPHAMVVGQKDMELFAELIVQECLVKIKVWEQDSRNHISYLLKQHFGIEQ